MGRPVVGDTQARPRRSRLRKGIGRPRLCRPVFTDGRLPTVAICDCELAAALAAAGLESTIRDRDRYAEAIVDAITAVGPELTGVPAGSFQFMAFPCRARRGTVSIRFGALAPDLDPDAWRASVIGADNPARSSFVPATQRPLGVAWPVTETTLPRSRGASPGITGVGRRASWQGRIESLSLTARPEPSGCHEAVERAVRGTPVIWAIAVLDTPSLRN